MRRGLLTAAVGALALACSLTAHATCNGVCQDSDIQPCATPYLAGLCPGPSSMKCCPTAPQTPQPPPPLTPAPQSSATTCTTKTSKTNQDGNAYKLTATAGKRVVSISNAVVAPSAVDRATFVMLATTTARATATQFDAIDSRTATKGDKHQFALTGTTGTVKVIANKTKVAKTYNLACTTTP